MSVIFFLRNHDGFDPDAIKAMGDAFDAACSAIVPEQSNAVKEIIATRIIDAARKGERDPQRLCAKALDVIGRVRRYS